MVDVIAIERLFQQVDTHLLVGERGFHGASEIPAHSLIAALTQTRLVAIHHDDKVVTHRFSHLFHQADVIAHVRKASA